MRPDTAAQNSGELAQTYTYDAIGNRTRSATQPGDWHYNADNQLTDWGQGREASQLTYTHHGLTTYYFYGPTGLALETDAQGKPLNAYAWRPNCQWCSDPVAQLTPSGASLQSAPAAFIHTDHLQTPQVATDSQGKVVWQGQAEVFGRTQTQGSLPMPWRFPGQYADAETNLYYNGMRTYNPQTGRYLERDPLGLAAGVNVYGYVDQNPVMGVDSWGLEAGDVGLIQVMLPAHTALVSRDPIGGTVESQLQYANIVNSNRMLGVEIIREGYSLAFDAKMGIEGIKACYAVPDTLYHFTSKTAAENILKDGVISVGNNNMYGKGVYATRFNSRIMASIQGAAETEASVVIRETSIFRPTPFPGTFRTVNAPAPVR